MPKRKTHEEYIKELKIINSNIEVVGEYKYARDNIKVKCLNCTGEWEPMAYSLLSGNGCPYCSSSPKDILIGFNDIWTINPELAKLLSNSSDGYKYTQHSNKKVDWKCPNCKEIIKNKSINDVSRRGLSCSKCGDGVSYPEKFIFNILEQLNINFQTQLSKTTFKWCDKYKYDFYVPYLNCIIETHGMQHYENISGNWNLSLQKIQDIDKRKEILAINNEINHYIILDCRKSELGWIKNSILNSKLNDIFDLSIIDWNNCHKFACSNLIKTVCNYWNNGINNIREIADITNMCSSTIRKYLKQGAILKWCNYNAKEEIIRNNIISKQRIGEKNVVSKKVICLETGIIFESISKAAKNVINGSISHIASCCKGKRKTCGKLEDGTKLHWAFI